VKKRGDIENAEGRQQVRKEKGSHEQRMPEKKKKNYLNR